MTDGDVAIKSALEQLFPVSGEPDWDEVISAARRHRAGSRRQLALAVAVAALVAITIVTPLGAEIARGLGGFSNWISGEPGQPAPRSEQQRFARENGRSWLGFPRGTQLRRLIATRSGDATVTLDGFRTGTSAFCLRLSVKGKTPVGTLECAPLADLRRQDAPVRVLIADRPVGRGTKNAWRTRSHPLRAPADHCGDRDRCGTRLRVPPRHAAPNMLRARSVVGVGLRLRSSSSGGAQRMRKDVREFIRRLEAAGLTVESTPGHYRVLRDGKPLRKANGMPFMLPFSPDTIRWRRAAIVDLRKLGIDVQHLSAGR
jgi:hypothetical protein